jgi:NAD(P)-dependent dehydrogenase (short-subunit alcohol dehydrogenase family)
VTISSSSSSKVEASVETLKKSFPSSKIVGYACDLSKPTLEKDIETLFEQTGKIDHIVFTAGDKLASMPIQEVTLEKIQRAGQIRLFAPFLVAKVGSRYLGPGPESSITLTTGGAGEHPPPNWSIVATYCAGLHGLTKSLAVDLKPIRVNLVSPGLVDTNLWADMSLQDRENMYKAVSAKTLTGKVGQADDVAETYLWLMRDKNSTGTIATSDSGSHLS